MATQNNIIIRNNNECAINELKKELHDLQSKVNNNEVFNSVLQEFIVPIKRGQVISINKIIDINPGFSLYGPNQPVSVYKIVYYSNDTRSQTVERCSGTLCIPQNITKNEMICQLRGTLVVMSNAELGHIYLPEISKNPDINARSTINDGIASVSLSGLGYVVFCADGLGYGESSGSPFYADYDAETEPHIDLTRAMRNLVIKKPELFNNKFSLPLNIIVTGYSLGGIFGPAYANMLLGDSINVEERKDFKIKNMLLGAIVNLYEFIKYNIDNPIVSLAELFFSCLGIYRKNDNILYCKPNAFDNIFPLFKDWSQEKTTNEFLFKFSTAIILDSIENPPVNNNYVPPITTKLPGTNIDFVVAVDARQFIILDQWSKYINYFKLFSSLNNKFKPLTDISGIPLVNIYSIKDELIIKNNIDFGAKLDINATKLGRVVNVKDISANDILSPNLVNLANEIKQLSGNIYNRYVVNISDTKLQGHGAFSIVYLVILLNALK